MTTNTRSKSTVYADIEPMLTELRALASTAIATDERDRIAEIPSYLAMWSDNLRPCAECGLVIECDRHEQSLCTLRPGDDRDVSTPAYY